MISATEPTYLSLLCDCGPCMAFNRLIDPVNLTCTVLVEGSYCHFFRWAKLDRHTEAMSSSSAI